MKKISKKEMLNPAMFVIRCPECGHICASASEIVSLPSWTTCDKCNIEITKKQNARINELTKKFGMNQNNSQIEEDNNGTYYYFFKSAYGDGYACIQKNGAIEAGNLGYFEPL